MKEGKKLTNTKPPAKKPKPVPKRAPQIYKEKTDMKNCKLCGDPTDSIYNIDFKATHVCDGCGNAIFIQQASWFSKKESSRIRNKKKK